MNSQDSPINSIIAQIAELIKHPPYDDDFYKEPPIGLIKATILYAETQLGLLTEQSKEILANLKEQFTWAEEKKFVYEQSTLADDFLVSEGKMLLNAIDNTTDEQESKLVGKLVKPYIRLVRSYGKLPRSEEFITDFSQAYEIRHKLVNENYEVIESARTYLETFNSGS